MSDTRRGGHGVVNGQSYSISITREQGAQREKLRGANRVINAPYESNAQIEIADVRFRLFNDVKQLRLGLINPALHLQVHQNVTRQFH